MIAVDVLDPITALEPIGLDELNQQAALQTRMDRKYVLSHADLQRVLGEVSPDTRALEIRGARSFGYESVYFDTPDLTSYHLTAHRRRRRFKLRTRTYLDSAECWLEVKTRDRRGRTVKQRVAHACADRDTLTPVARRFADQILAEADVPAPAAMAFAPTLLTRYQRSTLYLPSTGSRVTIDTGLTWVGDRGHHLELPGLAVLETKTGSTASPVDRLLWAHGHRPTSISKYATGLAALREDLPANRWRRVLRHHFCALDEATNATNNDNWSL